MNNKSFLFLSILTFFSSVLLQAQHDFRKGYIITPNNDSIYGWIDFKPSHESTLSCSFKKDSLARVQDYFPNNLKAYGLLSIARYVTKPVKTDSLITPLFLECLVSGSIHLYYLRYLGADRYFVEKNNSLYELRNDDVSFVEDGRTYTKKSGRYKGVLLFVMADVPAIKPEVQKTEFNRKALVRLITAYYEAANKVNEYVLYNNPENIKTEKTKWMFRYGISVGGNYSRMKYSAKDASFAYTFIDNSTFPPTPTNYSPVFRESNIPNVSNEEFYRMYSSGVIPGLFLNLANNSKNSFQVELYFLQRKFSKKGFTLKMQSLMLPVLYKREFFYYNRLKPFFDIGVALYYDFNMDFDNLYYEMLEPGMENDIVYYQRSRFLVNHDNTNIKAAGSHLSFLCGLGLEYILTKRNRLELELRPDFTKQRLESSFSNHVFIQSKFKYSNLSLLARISF